MIMMMIIIMMIEMITNLTNLLHLKELVSILIEIYEKRYLRMSCVSFQRSIHHHYYYYRLYLFYKLDYPNDF